MALRAEGLTFAYGASSVLSDLDGEFHAGKLSCVLGRNGAGKSTLLKLLSGLLPLEQGKVAVNGAELAFFSRAAWAREVAFLPQSHSGIFALTVFDFVLTGRAAHVAFRPRRQDETRASEALDAVGMTSFRDLPYTRLSGGEQQLVRIAKLLVQDSRYLLLDEPVAHLDLANSHKVMRLLKSLAEKQLGIVCVMHDPLMACRYADELFLLSEGRMQSSSIPPDDGQLSQALGAQVRMVQNALGVEFQW